MARCLPNNLGYLYAKSAPELFWNNDIVRKWSIFREASDSESGGTNGPRIIVSSSMFLVCPLQWRGRGRMFPGFSPSEVAAVRRRWFGRRTGAGGNPCLAAGGSTGLIGPPSCVRGAGGRSGQRRHDGPTLLVRQSTRQLPTGNPRAPRLAGREMSISRRCKNATMATGVPGDGCNGILARLKRTSPVRHRASLAFSSFECGNGKGRARRGV